MPGRIFSCSVRKTLSGVFLYAGFYKLKSINLLVYKETLKRTPACQGFTYRNTRETMVFRVFLFEYVKASNSLLGVIGKHIYSRESFLTEARANNYTISFVIITCKNTLEGAIYACRNYIMNSDFNLIELPSGNINVLGSMFKAIGFFVFGNLAFDFRRHTHKYRAFWNNRIFSYESSSSND